MGVTTQKAYEELTIHTAIEYAKQLNIFEQDANVIGEEIGDGNLNYVFRLKDQSGKSIILKQALPYAKVVGESWPLTLKRAYIEARALQKHGEIVPTLVPKVLHIDEVLAVTVMEDLSHLHIARKGLANGIYYPKLAASLATYLAKTLYGTSDFGLHPFEKKQLQAEFSNPELCKITEDLIFTDPYYDTDTNDFEDALADDVRQLWQNDALKLEVAKIKYSFLTEGEALLHGDLHTGSVFASEDEIKVIDPEFAFYGPIGFDVGQVIANILFQYFVRVGDQQQQILNDVKLVWVQFEKQFKDQWSEKNEIQHATVPGYFEATIAKIFKDTIGFAGTELIRRTIGLAHVADLDSITEDEKRLAAKRNSLRTGQAFILNREKITTIEEFIQLIKDVVK